MIDPYATLAYLQFSRGDEVAPAREGMTAVRADALSGLPLRVMLDATYAAILVVPTGSAYVWQTAPAGQLVTESALDRAAPVAAPTGKEDRWALAERDEPGARVLVTRERTRIGSLPLRAGLRGRFPAAGAAELELEIVDFRIEAGSVRGAPALGTFLSLAWRPMTAAAMAPPEQAVSESVRALAATQRRRKPIGTLPHKGFDIARIYRLNDDV